MPTIRRFAPTLEPLEGRLPPSTVNPMTGPQRPLPPPRLEPEGVAPPEEDWGPKGGVAPGIWPEPPGGDPPNTHEVVVPYSDVPGDVITSPDDDPDSLHSMPTPAQRAGAFE